MGCSRRTIELYLRLLTWPVRQHRRHYGRSVLNPYQDYLLERWNAGCRTAIQLLRELQPRGYTGNYHIPSDLVVDSCPPMLRAAQPLISR